MGLCSKIAAKCRALIWYRFTFRHYGRRSLIIRPLQLDGTKNISIGDRVVVGEGSWLAALPLTGSEQPNLEIGNRCSIGHFNHIYATREIVLEQAVLTADHVYISDNQHGYADIHQPVKDQPIRQLRPVRIGEGSWLGENVCVMGASIGKHCVIGANAVVTRDVPDYSVAVGCPARVIKRYNPVTQQWQQTDDK